MIISTEQMIVRDAKLTIKHTLQLTHTQMARFNDSVHNLRKPRRLRCKKKRHRLHVHFV
ncbi:uncharacterized protein PHALS_06602 [Plasmopara halstedii]|uniref:Uncharacterized protein n=1 Tax=Plasmopara halstedii TaxID=4781 RepID=A0A0P1B2W1_PLAHL|nr:uncharacterized protein PHALS_06602 [Plasmopara halstedii]CEG48802.1 hypothetical protein PHALS_06602 [Plasmopara halstedii]|eukprot:XP_024585171.1 hypothetical protein PHALS_06602 [Plasmopara halstedii]